MTKEELEKEAKKRAKDYTENKERQVAYECGFLDGADVLEEEIKNKISEHKECCKKLAEEYRQRYNEDKTDKLSLNMFYHNVIAYNNFETVLSMIEDRNSMIMCFGEPPLLTEKTVEVELNHIAELEKENATLKKQLDALSGDVPWSKLKDVSEVTKKLTEAKEIIENIIRVTWGEGWNYSLDWKVKADQFLKYNDDLENCRDWHSRDNLREL
jgi:hypothetical protein